MGKRGTAVARESADLVLLEDRFADLVGALAIHLPIAALSLLPLLVPAQPLILLPLHIALLLLSGGGLVWLNGDPGRVAARRLVQQGFLQREGA